MSKSAKTLVITIGVLSTLSGVFLVTRGAEFSEYFSGIFLGIVLIGSAIMFRQSPDSDAEN